MTGLLELADMMAVLEFEECQPCGGTGADHEGHDCKACKGLGTIEVSSDPS